MFPLGSVLFPSLVLPLHVFEPRYRALVRHCLEHEREFGVVLIERGSEVGGGDVRTSVGTFARIVQAEEAPDGRWAVLAVGTRRLRVGRWLPDDPYPRADAEVWDDAPEADASEAFEAVVPLLRRALALKSEVGEAAAPATIELAPDPGTGSHQIAAVGPLGPADQQRLLAAPGSLSRLELARALLAEEIAVLEQRLALG